VRIGKTRLCDNNCVFCFVDQLPDGLRSTLYEKDDDWRMSLLFGNYVTFTNVSERQIRKIIRRKYSPLYISVHSTDAKVRQRLLRCKSGTAHLDIMPLLRRFKENGIVLHAQVVLCPGINDGEHLVKTIEDLHGLVRSLAIVPVGLTKFRKRGLLRPVTPEYAVEIIKIISAYQQKYLQEDGTRFVWCADEFYTLSGTQIPDYDFYENFAQIDDGVGMLAALKEEFELAIEDCEGQITNYKLQITNADIVTGVSAYPFIKELCALFCEKFPNAQISVHKVTNNFFGESVTVAGLIAGRDIAAQLKGKLTSDTLLIPDTMLKAHSDLFLDGMTVATLEKLLSEPEKNVKVIPTAVNGEALINALCHRDGAVDPLCHHQPSP